MEQYLGSTAIPVRDMAVARTIVPKQCTVTLLKYNCVTWLLYISASIALLYVELCFWE